MGNPTLLAEVAAVVREAAKIAPSTPIGPESRLVDDLGIDSLDLVGVLVEIQDRFDVAIDDEDVPRLERLADLALYVEHRRGQAAA